MANIKRIPTPYSYSAAVVAGNQVYLGLHRGFGDNFHDQLEGTLAGVKETLAKLDIPLGNLVKVNVWLKDIKDLPAMEKQFANHFEHDQYPARMTATTQFIDADCLLMIDGIAYIGN